MFVSVSEDGLYIYVKILSVRFVLVFMSELTSETAGAYLVSEYLKLVALRTVPICMNCHTPLGDILG